MIEYETAEDQGPSRKAKIAAFFCSLFGTMILLSVIACGLAMTLPHYVGYELFHVVSGSMEPSIPVGSVVYVKPTAPETVAVGQVIAFESEGSVVIHRVVNNKIVEGLFTTKGDANEGEDMTDLPYDRLIGVEVLHVPYLGQMMVIFSSAIGKIYILAYAACGVLLNVLAGRLRS